MLRLLIAVLFAAALTLAPTQANVGLSPFAWSGSVPSSFTPAWQTLSIGAGGEQNNISLATSDNTLVSAQNTFGAYLYKATGTCAGADNGGWGTTRAAPCWEELFTQTSAPLTITGGVVNLAQGVNEIDVCNNNTNDAYAVYNKTLYSTTTLKSAAASRTWTSTGQTTTQNPNPGTNGYHEIACDPANPNVMFWATPSAVVASGNGLNASPSFVTITSVGTPGANTSDVIAFDGTPSAPTQTCTQYTGSPTCTKHVVVFVQGSGLYESYNGGAPASFVQTTGGPSTIALSCAEGPCMYLKPDKFGRFLVTVGDTTVHIYTPNGTAGSGTWSTTTAAGVNNGQVGVFAIDPTSTSTGTLRIAAAYADGNIVVSTNGGSTWCTIGTMTFSASGAQPGWFANANQNQGTSGTFMQAKDLEFDTSGNLWLAGGIGMWEILSANVGCSPNWVANTVGIESVVSSHLDSASPLGAPIYAAWDRAFWYAQNLDVYPSHHWSDFSYVTNIDGVQGGWAIDYAAGTTYVTGYAGNNANSSASSPNAGANSWARWTGNASLGTINVGGNIAASTASNFIVVPERTANNLSYTINGGGAFSAATFTGGIASDITQPQGHGFSLAADRVTANTFCLVDQSYNVWASTNSGQTWNKTNTTALVNNYVGGNYALKGMPGQAGTFYFAAGNALGSVTSFTFYKITKTTNECDTVTVVNSNITNVFGFGFGAPKPGGANIPTIYFFGANSGVYGLYELDNGSTTPVLIQAPSGAQTWPNNSGDFINDVSGSMDFYGRVLVGHNGSGATYIDTQNACPTVSLNITPNQTVSGTINLTATGSGKVQVMITSVSFYVDGTLIGTQSSPTGSGTFASPYVFTQSWNTASLATGTHTLQAAVTGNGCSPTSSTNYSNLLIPVTK